MKAIGEIRDIYRYPVKSFQGERLSSVPITAYGLYGDRGYDFIDHTRSTDPERSNKKLNAKFVPRLMAYRSEYITEGTDEAFPEVKVTAPDGREFAWDEHLFEEIRQVASPREISPRIYSPKSEGLLGVDEAMILITTDISLNELEKINGKFTDLRRFRPNFVIRYADPETSPFDEFDWVGKIITIGETELEVYKRCHRCAMVNFDPAEHTTDKTVLKNIVRHDILDACFGVYARVVRTGLVRIGDAVTVIG